MRTWNFGRGIIELGGFLSSDPTGNWRSDLAILGWMEGWMDDSVIFCIYIFISSFSWICFSWLIDWKQHKCSYVYVYVWARMAIRILSFELLKTASWLTEISITFILLWAVSQFWSHPECMHCVIWSAAYVESIPSNSDGEEKTRTLCEHRVQTSDLITILSWVNETLI